MREWTLLDGPADELRTVPARTTMHEGVSSEDWEY